jgi:hypothetical protein
MTREEKLEYMRTWNRKKLQDPEYRQKEHTRYNERYHNDPDFRTKRIAQIGAWRMERRKTDPEFRTKVNAQSNVRNKERYQNDPQYRAKRIANSIAWINERRRNDPQYRAKGIAQSSARIMERYNNDPGFAAMRRLRSTLCYWIRKHLNGKKSARTKDLIGCSVDYLMEHLLRPFPADVDVMETHHIDHIIPCFAFDATLAEEQFICFHWSNLQLLPEAENISKSAKWNLDFNHIKRPVSNAVIKRIRSRYKTTRWHRLKGRFIPYSIKHEHNNNNSRT